MSEKGRTVHLAVRREPRQVSTPVLVEDDPRLRVMFQLLLEGEGYAVMTAADGLEAVRHARRMRPSLVILDVELPFLDGYQVGSELRLLYGGALPIVFVTASGKPSAAADGIQRCGYLHKPFDVDGLLALVWRCLESARSIYTEARESQP
jgi:DNA-binding response OmpR family regulator